MPTIKEKPEGDSCYETHIFGDSKECPDYDGSVSMKPECRKYDKVLLWTVSGRVLKCDECLENK